MRLVMLRNLIYNERGKQIETHTKTAAGFRPAGPLSVCRGYGGPRNPAACAGNYPEQGHCPLESSSDRKRSPLSVYLSNVVQGDSGAVPGGRSHSYFSEHPRRASGIHRSGAGGIAPIYGAYLGGGFPAM